MGYEGKDLIAALVVLGASIPIYWLTTLMLTLVEQISETLEKR
jgi:ABC-type antimicrobial peptide transport system permease subunit